MPGMRAASVLWKQLNAMRYKCEVCGYKTHNRALFQRHLQSSRHFLMTTFRGAPPEIKILVMSYLPVWKIIQAPEYIAKNALRLAWPRPAPFDRLPRVVLPALVQSAGLAVSPLVRSAGGATWIVDNGQIRSYATLL